MRNQENIDLVLNKGVSNYDLKALSENNYKDLSKEELNGIVFIVRDLHENTEHYKELQETLESFYRGDWGSNKGKEYFTENIEPVIIEDRRRMLNVFAQIFNLTDIDYETLSEMHLSLSIAHMKNTAIPFTGTKED